jgi:hypothetical protein
MLIIEPPIDMGGYDIARLDNTSKRYQNGHMVVQAFSSDGAPALTVSVNIPESMYRLGAGEFFLKNWSENEAPVNAMLERGLIVVTNAISEATGFVSAPIARLNPTLMRTV